MAEVAVKRGKRNAAQADIYSFFFHAMPPDREALTLPELHELIRDVWLTRHEVALEEERAARRKGRPKSTKELKLEEIKLLEGEEYRTGMEVIDLTHPENVKLFRAWDQTEFPFIQLLRFIRISSTNLESAVVSRPGKHVTLLPPKPKKVAQIDEEEVPDLLPPPADEADMTVDP
jgi:translation machinery-associated protein 16